MKNYDLLNLENEKSIKLGNEKILFSDKIKKMNFEKISAFQNRYILITNVAIYNLRVKKDLNNLKYYEIRSINKIEDLYGITYSSVSEQFIIHYNEKNFDYLYKSDKRDIIILILQNEYEKIKNKDLLFSIKDEQGLSKYVVSKKERKANPSLFKLDKNKLTPIKQFFEKKNININLENEKDKDNILINGIKHIKLEDKDDIKVNENNFQKIDLNSIKNNDIKNMVEKIMKKENDIINIIYPEEDIKDTKDLITLYFKSDDQSLKCAVICKNNEIFNVVVNKIFEKEPRFAENFNYFLCNGNIIKEYKSLIDNKIKNGDVILLNQNDDSD